MMTHDTVKDAAAEITQDAPRAPTRLSAVLAAATREMTYPRNGTGNGRRFSANQILQWVDTFKAKEGRPPRWRDRSVWNRDSQNQPVLIRNLTWRVIDQYIQDGWLYCDGVHARSLHHLLETKGYFAEQKLSADKLRNWIEHFHEKEGKYPSHADKTVWEKAKDGAWRAVTGESWDAINQSLRQGGRGLDVVPERSLAEFKRAHGFVRPKAQRPPIAPRPGNGMTTAKVLNWLQLFREKAGKYPSHIDKTIWERDAKGVWVTVPGQSWGAVNMWLRHGHADGKAKDIRSLAELKDKLGVRSKRGRQIPVPAKIMLKL